jgi:hypothetical protein
MILKLIWGGFALVGVGLWFAMWFGAARWNGTTSQFVETLIQAIPRGEVNTVIFKDFEHNRPALYETPAFAWLP